LVLSSVSCFAHFHDQLVWLIEWLQADGQKHLNSSAGQTGRRCFYWGQGGSDFKVFQLKISFAVNSFTHLAVVNAQAYAGRESLFHRAGGELSGDRLGCKVDAVAAAQTIGIFERQRALAGQTNRPRRIRAATASKEQAASQGGEQKSKSNLTHGGNALFGES
jgi:hypothetical protein